MTTIEERREPPGLDFERLFATCASSADQELVADVIDATHLCPDSVGGHSVWLCTAVALRALLVPHQPTEHQGKCGRCATDWPCWTWREAHDWIFRYDPIHGRRVYDWVSHEPGAEDSIGLEPEADTVEERDLPR